MNDFSSSDDLERTHSSQAYSATSTSKEIMNDLSSSNDLVSTHSSQAYSATSSLSGSPVAQW